MQKWVLLIIFSFILISCKIEFSSNSLHKQAKIKEEVNTILNDWHQAAAEANFENYFNRFDSISVYIGTDASENWNKKQFADFSKPYFDAGKAWSFKTIERNIYTNSTANFVWFDELLNTWMGTCRGSGVLEKTNNEWKIKHYVLSVSIPNDDIQKVISVKQKNDSIFLNSNKHD
ncbi:nuclear transport factor 2 family protein [uncultured Polaribacter sp.]|uniref:nuclear transport factor 2 family protein n=1 Tax=uncultured Polaribacter sp. TaxID=174711 RepID=UPI0030DD89CB|tara:strand:+ start:1471 stop:1995 length:525 start_codon:yes stop_codon:yes gene_type:complete